MQFRCTGGHDVSKRLESEAQLFQNNPWHLNNLHDQIFLTLVAGRCKWPQAFLIGACFFCYCQVFKLLNPLQNVITYVPCHSSYSCNSVTAIRGH